MFWGQSQKYNNIGCVCGKSKGFRSIVFSEKKYEEPGKDLNLHQTHIMVYLKMDGWTQVFLPIDLNYFVVL